MEKASPHTRGLNNQKALQVFIAVCAVLVLIILYSAFQKTDGGALSGEIYLRPGVAQESGE